MVVCVLGGGGGCVTCLCVCVCVFRACVPEGPYTGSWPTGISLGSKLGRSAVLLHGFHFQMRACAPGDCLLFPQHALAFACMRHITAQDQALRVGYSWYNDNACLLGIKVTTQVWLGCSHSTRPLSLSTMTLPKTHPRGGAMHRLCAYDAPTAHSRS